MPTNHRCTAQVVATFAAEPQVHDLKISDGFSKIMDFAVWATPWPPKGELGGPRAARGGPGWFSGGPGGLPGRLGGHFGMVLVSFWCGFLGDNSDDKDNNDQ